MKEVQAMLTAEWMSLIEAIQERGKGFEAPGEVHGFNRDIAEALSRIFRTSAALNIWVLRSGGGEEVTVAYRS